MTDLAKELLGRREGYGLRMLKRFLSDRRLPIEGVVGALDLRDKPNVIVGSDCGCPDMVRAILIASCEVFHANSDSLLILTTGQHPGSQGAEVTVVNRCLNAEQNSFLALAEVELVWRWTHTVSARLLHPTKQTLAQFSAWETLSADPFMHDYVRPGLAMTLEKGLRTLDPSRPDYRTCVATVQALTCLAADAFPKSWLPHESAVLMWRLGQIVAKLEAFTVPTRFPLGVRVWFG